MNVRRIIYLLAILASLIGASPEARAHTSSITLAHRAGSDPYACDFDHDARYGIRQRKCVIRVVFRRDGPTAVGNALRVSYGESGLECDGPDNHNSNGTIDVGLFQINSVHRQLWRLMRRCVPNALFARRLWVSVGRRWSPTWVAASKLGIR